jgi:hypothetical protein
MFITLNDSEIMHHWHSGAGTTKLAKHLEHWGWEKQYTPNIMKKFRDGYNKTFRKLIPELVEQYDGTQLHSKLSGLCQLGKY